MQSQTKRPTSLLMLVNIDVGEHPPDKEEQSLHAERWGHLASTQSTPSRMCGARHGMEKCVQGGRMGRIEASRQASTKVGMRLRSMVCEHWAVSCGQEKRDGECNREMVMRGARATGSAYM